MKQQISQETYNYLSNKILLDYVKDATPILWHQMAMDWNYDNDNAFFHFLINNTKTDRATALMIYWMCSPYYAKQFVDEKEVREKQPWYIDDFSFVESLEYKLINGFFVNNQFAYNPKGDHTGTDWTEKPENSTLVRSIPSVLYQPLEGQKISIPINFIEGIPRDIQDQWQKLDEEYDIV